MTNHFHAFPLNSSPVPQWTSFWRGGVLSDGTDKIVEYCDKLALKTATVGDSIGQREDTQIRTTDVAFVLQNAETAWIYDGMAGIAQQLNHDYYNFDLSGFLDMQYAVYKGDTVGHYNFHVDMMGKGTISQRKLSLVMQLSDPFDYDGGELQIWNSDRVIVPREKGLIYAFPSWMLHRVTPVTRGVRKTLTCWVVGPQFR